MIKRIKRFLSRRVLPFWLINVILMIKYRCKIDLGARIEWAQNLKIGRGSAIGRCVIRASGKITIDKFTEIGEGTILDSQFKSLVIGEKTRIGHYVVINGDVEIGKKTMIALHSAIIASTHNHERCDLPMMDQGVDSKKITIGDDVWIGAGVKILQGINIGNSTIIGAGSVVTKDIETKSIAFGTPARIHKKRTS